MTENLENEKNSNRGKITLKQVSNNTFEKFIKVLENNNTVKITQHNAVSDKNHFDNYRFLRKNGVIKLSYDTKANYLLITGNEENAKFFNSVFLTVNSENKLKTGNPADMPKEPGPENPRQNEVNKPAGLPINNAEIKIQNIREKTTGKLEKKQSDHKIKSMNSGQDIVAGFIKTEHKKQARKPIEIQGQKPAVSAVENLTQTVNKNGFSIKKCDVNRLNALLERVISLPEVVLAQTEELTQAATKGQKMYIFESKNKEKMYLTYIPKTKTLMCQGKHSELYINIQVILSEQSDEKKTVKTYIAPGDVEVKASKVNHSLSKRIPNAMEFLSMQAETYLGYTYLSVCDKNIVYPEYSGEITRAGKALENLISKLLLAEEIKVNAIGQAFEKNEQGSYMLKIGYQNRIKKSIVYNEVLSALYTEYAVRNYYSHSDNTNDNVVRLITNKQEAEKIFENLLNVIEYNCRKLKEIGFSF